MPNGLGGSGVTELFALICEAESTGFLVGLGVICRPELPLNGCSLSREAWGRSQFNAASKALLREI